MSPFPSPRFQAELVRSFFVALFVPLLLTLFPATARAEAATVWEGHDIGAVGVPGSDGASGDTVTVSGSGADIAGAADAFHFRAAPLTGDGAMVAHVVNRGTGNDWGKAGVMFRESLAPGAKNVLAYITPAQHIGVQSRAATGGATTASDAGAVQSDYWLMLDRQGDTFRAYRSWDGNSWSPLGTVTVAMAASVYYGVAVTSHDNAALMTATFDNVFDLPGDPPPTSRPAGPYSFEIFDVRSDLLHLRWSDTALAGGGYELERTTQVDAAGNPVDGSFVRVATLPAGTATFTDTGLAPHTPYYYRLRIWRDSEVARYSNYANAHATTDSAAPGTAITYGTYSAMNAGTVSGGQISVAGVGDQFGGTLDSGTYYQWTWSGDVDFVAHVASLANSNPVAQAGLMIRANSFDGDAANAAIVLTAGNGTAFQARAASGAATEVSAGPALAAPAWLRLTRTGDLFTGYVSTDGVSWTTVGSKTIPLAAELTMGFAVSAHAGGAGTTAVFDQVSPALAHAPNAPGSFHQTAATASAVTLAWDDNSTDETAFELQRLTYISGLVSYNPPAVLLATLPANTTSYTDDTVGPGMQYLYYLRAVRDGRSSAWLDPLRVSTPGDPVPPAPPSDLRADLAGATSVHLVWTEDPVQDVYFEIERRVAGAADFAWLGAVTPHVTNFTDTSVGAGTTYEYRVHASRNSVQSADSNVVTIRTTPADNGSWTGGDVGAASAPGSAEISGDTFTLRTSGGDIWDQGDSFRFQYQQWHGDGQFVARVASLTNTNPWAKAGIMLRTSLEPGSANVAMLLTAAQTSAFQVRAAGGTTAMTGGPWVNAPYWVKLSRVGNVLSGYVSADGTAWTAVGSQTVVLGTDVYAGLAVSSHNSSAVATATFDHVAFTGDAPPPPSDSWASHDIGTSGPAGSTSGGGDTVTLNAGGGDIWNAADSFRFHAEPWHGDGMVTAHVASLTNTNPWAKAGVMIRETLQPGSANAAMLLTAANASAFQSRNGTGLATIMTQGAWLNPPYWVRVTRSGNLFSGYVSADGVTWTLVGSQTFAMTADVFVGVAASSHNAAAQTVAAFDHLTVAADAPASPPPAAPTGLRSYSASGIRSTSLHLLWDDTSNDEDGFEVYRRVGTDFQVVGTVGANGYDFNDTGLTPETQYVYCVRSIRGGVRSAESNTFTLTTATYLSPLPTAPAYLRATAVTASTFHFEWGDSSDNEDGFELSYSVDNGPDGLMARTGPNVSSWDASLASNHHYTFYVRAIRGGAQSAWSNAVDITMPPSENDYPVTPAHIAVDGSSSGVDVSWPDESPNETGFEVERATGDGAFALLGTTSANVNHFTDPTVVAGTRYSYRVRAVNHGGYSDYSPVGTIELSGGTTGGWSGTDIGPSGAPGSESGAPPTVTLNAGGSDIYGVNDSFRYLWQGWNGDGTIIARVASLANTNPWAKAGVMFRATLQADAANAAMLLSAANVCSFQARATAAGATASQAGGYFNAPYWVKLSRVGNTFTGYISADGATWTLVGSQDIVMPAQVYVGLAASAHASAQTVAAFDHVGVSAGSTPPSAGDAWTQQNWGTATGTASGDTTLTIAARSGDLWDAADSGVFAAKTWDGDGEIVAKVDSLGATHDWAKGALEFRSSLAANAANACVAVTASSGIVFQTRGADGGTTSLNVQNWSGGPGSWIKLKRTGNTFTASFSANGSTWTDLGALTFVLPAHAYVGAAASSHTTATSTTAVFSNLAVH